MLWIYQVQSNDVRWLQERNVHIWDEWEIQEDGKWYANQLVPDENGKMVIGDKPNAYKFEMFIFDSYEMFDDVVVLRVKREEEFAPVKNAAGVDSPETARELYRKFYQL